MSLNWSVEDVKNYEDVCKIVATEDVPTQGIKAGEKIWNPVTTALVWHSLNTGIGRITDETAPEVYARIKLVEKLYGASLFKDGEERPITFEDVVAHIGLSTNANFGVETRAKFLKRHVASYLDETVASVKREQERGKIERVKAQLS